MNRLQIIGAFVVAWKEAFFFFLPSKSPRCWSYLLPMLRIRNNFVHQYSPPSCYPRVLTTQCFTSLRGFKSLQSGSIVREPWHQSQYSRHLSSGLFGFYNRTEKPALSSGTSNPLELWSLLWFELCPSKRCAEVPTLSSNPMIVTLFGNRVFVPVIILR